MTVKTPAFAVADRYRFGRAAWSSRWRALPDRSPGPFGLSASPGRSHCLVHVLCSRQAPSEHRRQQLTISFWYVPPLPARMQICQQHHSTMLSGAASISMLEPLIVTSHDGLCHVCAACLILVIRSCSPWRYARLGSKWSVHRAMLHSKSSCQRARRVCAAVLYFRAKPSSMSTCRAKPCSMRSPPW